MRRPGELAIALSLTVAAATAGYALYSYVGPADSGHVQAVVAQSTAQFEPAGEPLRMANPFDATEVFEFPAGTSEADAREAVAGFLIERAARRGVANAQRRPSTKG